jgi:hypothetical protein
LLFWGLLPGTSTAQSWSTTGRVVGFETGATISLGAYKAYASAFVNLARRQGTPVFLTGNEGRIYAYLGRRLLSPKYLVVQATLYPLATLSSYAETYHPRQFDRLEVAGFNVLRSLGSGSEEPYALSLLVGNIAFLGYYEHAEGSVRVRQAGSALAGLLLSTGHWHIHDNIRVNDRWWQAELILKGTSSRPGLEKLEWNFRGGVKLHGNHLAPDAVAFALFRDDVHWQARGFSLLANSQIAYEVRFPLDEQDQAMPFVVRHLFRYGKKFPLRMGGKRMVPQLGGGVLWEWVRSYDRQARRFQPHGAGQWVWLIQPTVSF